MTCPICKHGDGRFGTVAVTLERGGTTLVFKNVPAQVYEAYMDEATTEQLLITAEAGVQVEVQEFVAA